MAYKTVAESFWTDPKVMALNPIEKLLFLYLITNPHCHYSGIYYLPLTFMASETGLSKSKADNALESLVSSGLVDYNDNFMIVWVLNMARHQVDGDKRNQNMLKGIANQLSTLHECPLVRDFLDRYQDWNIPFKPLQSPFKAPSKGLAESGTEYRTGEEYNPPFIPPKFKETPSEGLVTAETIMLLWNDILVPQGFKQIKRLTIDLRDALKRKIADYPTAEEWKGAFSKISKSEMFKKFKWRPTLYWLAYKCGAMDRLLAGEFDGEASLDDDDMWKRIFKEGKGNE